MSVWLICDSVSMLRFFGMGGRGIESVADAIVRLDPASNFHLRVVFAFLFFVRRPRSVSSDG
jgi:hypothetical protein